MSAIAAAVAAFLVFVILFTLAARVAVSVMGRLAGRRVRTCHELAERIINSGQVPAEWQADDGRAPGARARRRLSRLIAHFEHTPLIDSETTRQLLLRELRGVQERYEPLRRRPPDPIFSSRSRRGSGRLAQLVRALVSHTRGH